MLRCCLFVRSLVKREKERDREREKERERQRLCPGCTTCTRTRSARRRAAARWPSGCSPTGPPGDETTTKNKFTTQKNYTCLISLKRKPPGDVSSRPESRTPIGRAGCSVHRDTRSKDSRGACVSFSQPPLRQGVRHLGAERRGARAQHGAAAHEPGGGRIYYYCTIM